MPPVKKSYKGLQQIPLGSTGFKLSEFCLGDESGHRPLEEDLLSTSQIVCLQ